MTSTPYEIGQRFTFTVGDKVVCNGYAGIVTKVHTDTLAGMVDVRLARGTVCVSACYPDVFPRMASPFDLTGLTRVQAGRVNAALDKRYRFDDGSVRSLRDFIEAQPSIEKMATDGMIKWDRATFNRLGGGEQEAYEKRLRAKRVFLLCNASVSIEVSKAVFDAVRA